MKSRTALEEVISPENRLGFSSHPLAFRFLPSFRTPCRINLANKQGNSVGTGHLKRCHQLRMRSFLLLASPLLAQLDIPGHRDLLNHDQSEIKPEHNQSSEVTQAEITSLFSGDQTRTFTVYPAVETVSVDEPVATAQPFLPTSHFFPQKKEDSEDQIPDDEVLERKSEAEPGFVLQGRSLGSDLVYPLKHHQDLNLQRKQQALNIQKQQQQQQALELMQQQQALQQQYIILQQQQALNMQQQNLPTVQQPYSGLQQQQPMIHQPYSKLQQPYSNLQQPYANLQPHSSMQGIQQSYNLPPVVQSPYSAGPVSFIPIDEPQTSASALGGQFQPYHPTYQDQYDDIGNEQVSPLFPLNSISGVDTSIWRAGSKS